MVGHAAQVLDLRPGEAVEAPQQLPHPVVLRAQLGLTQLHGAEDVVGEVRAYLLA